jgi:hypothetical protein
MENQLTAAQIIVKVMEEVQSLAKRDKNTQQGFIFRGIDAVMNAVGPALRKHNGFIMPSGSSVEYSTIPSKSGGLLHVARVSVTYSVYGQAGEPISGSVYAEAFDSGDKATAKAMSVAYRTFLLQLLCLPTDEPDPDSHSYETVAPAVVVEVPVDFLPRVASAKTLTDLEARWNEAVAGGFSKDVATVIKARKKELA